MSRRAKFIWSGLVVAALVVLVLILTGGAGEGIPSEPQAGATTTVTAAPPETTAAPPSTSSSSAPTETTSTVSSTAPTTTVPGSTVPSTVPPETTTTTLAPADDPDAGEDQEAPVPIGQAIVLGEWRIGVSAVELDATETVLGYVDFNEDPADGSQYLIVELSGVYLGNTFVQPVFDWALVKPEFSHVPEGLECGVVPNSIYDVDQVAPGGQFTASVCFEIPTAEVTDDLVLTLGLLDESGSERFFALR